MDCSTFLLPCRGGIYAARGLALPAGLPYPPIYGFTVWGGVLPPPRRGVGTPPYGSPVHLTRSSLPGHVCRLRGVGDAAPYNHPENRQ